MTSGEEVRSGGAAVYDALYSWKSYEEESAVVRQLLVEEGLKWETRVLEGACGTGRYLELLAHHFDVAGFDLDSEMLAEARRRLPQRVSLHRADLRDFVVDTPFDVFLLLFGGLGYVPPDDLDGALARIHDALRPGGLFICEPWLTPELFIPDRPHLLVVDRPELKISRHVVTQVEGRASILDYQILVSRPGEPVAHLRDLNVLYLVTDEELRSALERAGFVLEQTREGFMKDRPLLVLRRS